MGITGQIKQISGLTLDLLREDPLLTNAFFDAQWLPESAFWQRASYWPAEPAEKTKQEVKARFGQLPESKGLSWLIPGKRQKWKHNL
ncbi:hypothetical protein I8752_05220 [Nostocaceae cyanobacterium CENA369]|uniref:Uncharacterized protein n=1 Tax=Dendronalium phyllosphericum CENA369 TaxID=1725256 RepID=A0A8J7HY72_9NOST|nr:hypothetical protein [Dendronalium phyllosphericum]MBH8572444.1 hypothetical protein [Dendronalium phyllosphericum CENA369]